MTRKSVDWEALEPHYRAGIRSLKDIGDQFDASDAAIIKHARKHGWTRNIKGKVQARADALVSAATVSAEVSEKRALTEAVVVEVEAQVSARVQLAHRKDITRFRMLVLRLLAECEAEAGDPGLFQELGEMLRKPDENYQDKLSDTYHKAISLPQRIKGVKELADTLKTLISLEREAYGIVAEPPKPPDDSKVDKEDLARSIIFMLSKRLTPS